MGSSRDKELRRWGFRRWTVREMGNARDREFMRWGVHEMGSSEDGEFRRWGVYEKRSL